MKFFAPYIIFYIIFTHYFVWLSCKSDMYHGGYTAYTHTSQSSSFNPPPVQQHHHDSTNWAQLCNPPNPTARDTRSELAAWNRIAEKIESRSNARSESSQDSFKSPEPVPPPPVNPKRSDKGPAVVALETIAPEPLSLEEQRERYSKERMLNRAHAMHDVMMHGMVQQFRVYNLGPDVVDMLYKASIAVEHFRDFVGDQLQQAVHQDCVEMLNHFAKYSFTTLEGTLFRTCIELLLEGTDIGRRLNKEGKVTEAMAMLDACWEYHESLVKAAAEGIFLGVKNIATPFLYPILTFNALESNIKSAFLITAKILSLPARFALIAAHNYFFDGTRTIKSECARMVSPRIEKIKEGIGNIRHITGPGIVRTGFMIATECMAPSRILSSIGKITRSVNLSNRARTISTSVAVKIAQWHEKIKEAWELENLIAVTPEGIRQPLATFASKMNAAKKQLPSKARGKAGIHGSKAQNAHPKTSLPKAVPNVPVNEILNRINKEVGPKGTITNKMAKEAAKELGYEQIGEMSHKQLVFRKGNKYISADERRHNGGFWKVGNSVKELLTKPRRLGTYDIFLEKIGD